METENFLKLSKKLEMLVRDFNSEGAKIIETGISEGNIFMYFAFDYTFIKAMIRGEYESVKEEAYSKLTFKKDNVFYITYKNLV